MRVALGRVLVTAALVAWWLFAEEPDRGRSMRTGPAPVADTPAVVPEEPRHAPAPFEAGAAPGEGLAVVEGVVAGPSGPLWSTRVQVYAAGSDVAFDEVGTDTRGQFRLEFAVAPEGEKVDLRARPADDSQLESEWVRDVELHPGDQVRRDFIVAAGDALICNVRRGGPDSGGLDVAAIPWASWERVRVFDPDALPPWDAWREAACRIVRGKNRLAFKELPAGDYALVCVTPGIETTEAARARPGERVQIEVHPIPGVRVAVRDAATGVPITGATVRYESGDVSRLLEPMPGDPATYFVRLTPRGAGDTERDVMARVFGAKGRLRVEAGGFHPGELGFTRLGYQLVDRRALLVPLDAPSLRLRASGSAATDFLRSVTLQMHGPRRGRDRVSLAPPVLNKSDEEVVYAVPAGRWDLKFSDTACLSAVPDELSLTIPDSGEVTCRIELPEYGFLESDGPPAAEEDTPYRTAWASPFTIDLPTYVWESRGEDRFRLVPHESKRMTRNLASFWDPLTRSFRLPAGRVVVGRQTTRVWATDGSEPAHDGSREIEIVAGTSQKVSLD